MQLRPSSSAARSKHAPAILPIFPLFPHPQLQTNPTRLADCPASHRRTRSHDPRHADQRVHSAGCAIGEGSLFAHGSCAQVAVGRWRRALLRLCRLLPPRLVPPSLLLHVSRCRVRLGCGLLGGPCCGRHDVGVKEKRRDASVACAQRCREGGRWAREGRSCMMAPGAESLLLAGISGRRCPSVSRSCTPGG